MPNALIQPPYHPIVYVRGYAGSEDNVEETVATPYMGFNLGSTKIRQRSDGRVARHIFESPLVRLMKDHGYRDVYDGGSVIGDGRRIAPKSVVIYRYYDQVSEELGAGVRPDIEVYADGLSKLIIGLRDQICGGDAEARAAFRVHLVAHSMGGLICRCFLQNPGVGQDAARLLVDRVFTYATPHNGIDVRVLGNVPGFFSRNNADNFNRDRMTSYLALPPDSRKVNTLGDAFDPERFFCLVGTNYKDYEVASGWSRRVVGPMSDGLVLIRNASVKGAPRAFVHRSHSGHYGIVNSEGGYQNLTRFLFGDVRVDGTLEVAEITLPPKVQKAVDAGRQVEASYHFETILRVRGATYDLHRRTVRESSAVFRTFKELSRVQPRHPRLFSTFLDSSKRTRSRGPLVFSVDVRVRVPDYEIDRFFALDDHIEGSSLFRETITIAAYPPAAGQDGWRVRYGFDSSTPGRYGRDAEVKAGDGVTEFRIPLESRTRPGLKGALCLTARKRA